MICFNSGCSFTTPTQNINEKEMWFSLMASYLGCDKVINESRPASSNDLIIQRVYRHALTNCDKNVFYIINLTSLNRIEIEPSRSERMQEILVPEALVRYDQETIELTVYAQIVGVVSFLESRNLRYLIVNNSKGWIQGQWQPRDSFMLFMSQRPNICNLYEYARIDFHQQHSHIKPYDYDLYGWNGHDGPEGHHAYYEMLKHRLNI